MLYNLLASGANPLRKAGIGEASLYALLGFLVVFVGIIFLIFIVWATGKLISLAEGKPKRRKEKESKDKKTENSEAAENESAACIKSEEISEETLAIITAAIMAYYQKNNPKCEFTVKRIKRI